MPVATDGVKVCSACGVEQPVGAFYAQRSAADGRQSRCKRCQVHGPPAAPSAHPQTAIYGAEYLADDAGMKRCRSCDVRRSVVDFHASSGTADGLETRCRKCRHEAYVEQRDERLAYAASRQVRHGAEINARRRERLSDPATRQDVNARRRTRRAQDPEPDRAASRVWWAEHGHEVNARRRASEHPREPSLLATPDGMKVCRRCRINQPVTEFHHRTHVGRPADDLCPYCKTCKRARPWTARDSQQDRT